MTKWKYNEQARSKQMKASLHAYARDQVERAHRFHQTFDAYQETPLRCLPALAEDLGVAGVYVKDESYRFGLNAFKVLGGAYAIGRYLADRLGVSIDDLSFDELQTEEVKQRLGEITFITATDGNHGRGVAWAAQQLGQKAVVYMPKGSSAIRLQHIRNCGADGYITEWNYDECVRHCAKLADEHGWVVIQDTAWEGYEDIPEWIMQGYSTIALEVLKQLKILGEEKPTHVFLQAGVGSFAGAIQGVLSAEYGEERPISVIVEPDQADCLYRSALAGDGKPRHVGGMLDTIMAGLACGEPNPQAWDILRDYADMFVSCSDEIAALGMRVLGNPMNDDAAVISGESGAVTTGLLFMLMKAPELAAVRQQLQLNEHSRILLISTEGDTDPAHYRRIVWEGHHPIVK